MSLRALLAAALLAGALAISGCGAPTIPQAQMPTAWGAPTTFHYEDREGMAVAEGDILLGPVDWVESVSAGGGSSIDHRWPGGEIPYVIDEGVRDLPFRSDIRRAAEEFQDRTPIRFVPRDGQEHYVKVMLSEGGSHSAIGRAGWPAGEQSMAFRTNLVGGTTAMSSILHEFGHVAGLHHPHVRVDRRGIVDIHWDCIDEKLHARFWAKEDAVAVGRYDVESVMHFPSDLYAKKDDCSALTRTGGALVERQDILSVGDVNALWKLYGDFGAEHENGDEFGAALAAGDFDTDGFADLAVGAPAKRRSGVSSGLVYVFKGTDTGLVPWHTLTADSAGPPADGDRFGAFLLATDIDGDGADDLLAGAPGREGGQGAILSFLGRRGRRLRQHQAGTIRRAQRFHEDTRDFGWTAAVGDANGDGAPDLVVGAPRASRKDDDSGVVVQSGAAMVYRGVLGEAVRGKQRWAGFDVGRPLWEDDYPFGGFGTPVEDGDGVGHAVVVVDVDGDGMDEIFVGAPADRGEDGGGNSGAVLVFRGTRRGPEAAYRIENPSPEDGSRFGETLATGDLDGDGGVDLVVGAPGLFRERVEIFSFGADSAEWVRTVEHPASGAPRRPNGFGRVLLIADADQDGDDDLLVSAPRAGDSGEIVLFRQVEGDLQPGRVLASRDAARTGRFGSSLAAADFQGLRVPQLAVGDVGADATGEGAVRSGAVFVFPRPAAEPTVIEHVIHQTSSWPPVR